MLIKKRSIKMTNRFYIQDKDLLKTDFKPGTNYTFGINNNELTIVKSSKGTKVSSRQDHDLVRPVIDIRSKAALKMFDTCSSFELFIYKDHIIIKGNNKLKQCVGIGNINKDALEEMAACNHGDCEFKNRRIGELFKDTLNVVSLFSGAGFMDLGFKKAGFDLKFALELEKDMCETYRNNLGNHVVQSDINKYDLDKIPDAHVIIGGSPCQDFSNSNRVTKILDSPKNLLVKKWIEVVKKTKSCLVAVLENVPQLLTKGKKFVEEIKEELSNFSITIQLLNAYDFGTAQIRKRAFIIASKTGPINIVSPKSIKKTSVGDAFSGLTNLVPNQMDYTKSKDSTIEKMKHIKPGENFTSIPGEEHKQRQSNVYRRLEFDKPSITIVNPRKSQILHPKENRILSVRECARLFDVPDDYVFHGSLSSRQQMVANGVCVNVAYYIAKTIKMHIGRYLLGLS